MVFVSATALPYAAPLDVWLKHRGMSSSIGSFGCPSRMRVGDVWHLHVEALQNTRSSLGSCQGL